MPAATAWPTVTERDEPHPIESGPEPGVGPLSGPRWLYVWNRGLLGECACWRGTTRRQEGGAATVTEGTCTSPGKHPWIKREGEELTGFEHGAASALDYDEVIARYGEPGGARQLAVVLDDVLVVDLDSDRALRDFARCTRSVPKSKIIGISTSPRGYHVWLDCPGWNQRALNKWMASWLVNWHGTDEKVAGQRGFCFDVRTGFNRYVVWPGQHADRRWLSFADFTEVMRGQLYGMPPWRLAPTDKKAPWQVDLHDDAASAEWVFNQNTGEMPEMGDLWLTETGMVADLEKTWAELEAWCDRLLKMPSGSGRNNALNALAFYGGSRCIAAGHSPEAVEEKIVATGYAAGTHGIKATVQSGLRAGLQLVAKAKAASSNAG